MTGVSTRIWDPRNSARCSSVKPPPRPWLATCRAETQPVRAFQISTGARATQRGQDAPGPAPATGAGAGAPARARGRAPARAGRRASCTWRGCPPRPRAPGGATPTAPPPVRARWAAQSPRVQATTNGESMVMRRLPAQTRGVSWRPITASAPGLGPPEQLAAEPVDRPRADEAQADGAEADAERGRPEHGREARR